ncbi:MAG: hypothetical protein WCF65_02565 [Parachlamydiaceae bacterium]
MVTDTQREALIQKNHLSIDELSIRIDALNQDVESFLQELNVSPEQLTTLLSEKNNFTERNWNTILEQRKALDEKLLRALVNVANPQKTKKAYASRKVPSHWLFVR